MVVHATMTVVYQDVFVLMNSGEIYVSSVSIQNQISMET